MFETTAVVSDTEAKKLLAAVVRSLGIGLWSSKSTLIFPVAEWTRNWLTSYINSGRGTLP